MAESGPHLGTSEIDIAAMRETLQAQQQLLQKLYAELDQEREASSTAASEALSMILRLQGEKAAVKMEASQYKRVAEEKLSHAKESLEAFEDLVYHKEMVIASLEFQVQAYKFKLLSFGCGDDSDSVPESLASQGSEFADTRRGSYWQQIRDLDEQVKEIAHCGSDSDDAIVTGGGSALDEEKPISNIQDIFEVPKLDEKEERNGELCLTDHETDKSNLYELKIPTNLECSAALVQPTSIGLVADSQAKFQHLCERVERLEGERIGTSREIGFSGEEERELLREIHRQLRTIRTEIQSLNGKKKPVKDDQQVHCLKEAFLHFWF